MSSGTQALPAGKIGYLAAYVSLAVLTGVVAVMLISFNVDLGQDLAYDATSDAQAVSSWRTSAALAYTSGTGIGQVFALMAGMLARRWARTREVNGVAVAFLTGIGLGLADLVSAFVAAAPRLRVLAHAPQLMSYEGRQVIDPGLMHHGIVLVAMAMALILFAVASGFGFALARGAVSLGVLLVPLFILYALFIRSVGMVMAFVLTNTWT
jgi:hypothetical protein